MCIFAILLYLKLSASIACLLNLLSTIAIILGSKISSFKALESTYKTVIDKYSQEKKIKIFNPKKASRLSAVLPGLGQIYNKQYWKVPVIYGGYAVIGHYIKFNNGMYNDFKNALTLETDNDELTLNPFPNFSRNSLERNMDFWRRNRDMLIIFTGAYYLLNIVDAHIFAHLNEFDTDNDSIADYYECLIECDESQSVCKRICKEVLV